MQQLIRTVARRGYLFAASVTRPAVEFPAQTAAAPSEDLPAAPARNVTWRSGLLAGVLVLATLALGGVMLFCPTPPVHRELTYTQITNFTDSAVTPALSPDGRMLAFLRSNNGGSRAIRFM